MIDPELFDENENENGSGDDNIFSDDMFDGIIDILDFPMEEVDVGGEVEKLQRESSALNDLPVTPSPFSGNSCDHASRLRTISSDETTQAGLPIVVIDTCSGNISLHSDSSDNKESQLLQTYTASASGKPRLLIEPFAETSEASETRPMERRQRKIKRKKLSLISGATGTKKYSLQQLNTVGRCMHCNVTKTPQWREGPNGPKTLCNACGVCYKRGSLFPEYRPASSPTFVETVHSNSRRKVIEMRNKGGQDAANGSSETFATPLQSNSHTKVIEMDNNKAAHHSAVLPDPTAVSALRTNSCSNDVEIKMGASLNSKPNAKVIEIGNRGDRDDSMAAVSPFLAATSPSSRMKVMERRNNASQEAAMATRPTFVASLHSNSHKKCSFQQPVTVRKCMHCEATQTPLWRQGPAGPKSLCNACGIRYKSGRLFPEYHPAASPTFIASLHSNSHKKVLEMRNQGVAKKSQLIQL